MTKSNPESSSPSNAPVQAASGSKWPGTALVKHLVELLHAEVLVLNAQGRVIAGSDAQLLGVPTEQLDTRWQKALLRLSLSVLGQPVMILVGESHGDDVVSPRLARAFIELAVNQLPVTEQTRQEAPSDRDKFVYNVLHGFLDNDAVMLREAKRLGLNMVPRRAVILVDARQYILAQPDTVRRVEADAEVQRRAKRVIQSIVDCLLLPDDTICAYMGDGEIAVLKASSTQHMELWAMPADGSEQTGVSWTNLHALKRAATVLVARLQSDTGAAMSVGLGRYHPGLHGLARSYQDARAALSLGQRVRGHSNVHCLDELGLAAFVGVADEQTKIELATHLLSPLSHAPELLETLDVFFAQNCLPSVTAQQLSIHRNTLSHRLDKITALTGLDPHRFDDAVQIRLALLLRGLYKSS